MARWSVTAWEMPPPGMYAAQPQRGPGPQPPAHFGNFTAVKSSPPEADKPTSPVCFRRPNRGRDSTVGARIARPLGCAVRAPSPNRPACGGCGPMWASAPTPCRATHPHRRGGYQPLALAGRNAGREGLAATRTIGPYSASAANALTSPPSRRQNQNARRRIFRFCGGHFCSAFSRRGRLF